MNIEQLLQQILGGGQQPVNRMAGNWNGPDAEPNRLVAPQGLPVAAMAPHQGAPMPQQAPAAAPQASGGGILDRLFGGQSSGENQTIAWLQNEGMDPGTATMMAKHKPSLQAYLLERAQGADPLKQLQAEKLGIEVEQMRNPARKTTVIEGKLVDENTGELIKDYGDPNEFNFITGKDGSIFRTNKKGGKVEQVYGGKPDTFRVLTPEEEVKMGLDPTGAYQIGADEKVSKIGGEGTTVNIDQKAEGAFEKRAAEAQAVTFDAMATEGLNARADLAVIDQLDGLLAGQGGVATGIAGWLASKGLGTEGMGDLQAVQALISKLVPTQRAPGSGTISDADLALFKASLPSLWNQPEGNKIIISTMKGLATYKQQQGEIADQILNGEVSRQEGRRMLRELPNPLAEFSKAKAAAAPNKAGIDRDVVRDLYKSETPGAPAPGGVDPSSATPDSDGWREVVPGVKLRRVN